jgi:hypothetical protein
MRGLLTFALSVAVMTLAGCGGPTATGNDLGGVMSWSGQSPADAFKAAEAHCQKVGKRARIAQIVPPTGDAKGAVVFSCD